MTNEDENQEELPEIEYKYFKRTRRWFKKHKGGVAKAGAIGAAAAIIIYSFKDLFFGEGGPLPTKVTANIHIHDADTYKDLYKSLPTHVQNNLTYNPLWSDGNLTNGEIANATIQTLSDGSGRINYNMNNGLKWYQEISPDDLVTIIETYETGLKEKKRRIDELSLVSKSPFGEYT